ncbi:MAG: hypothetical protein FWF15_10295 [Oscillospiraceae bacterium]|nr:hypothetical protein [Oscillospiraceae bacterium]
MKIKRLISIIICAIFIVSMTLVACSEDNGTKNDGNTESNVTNAEDTNAEADSRLSVSDDLPKKDFGGAKFRIFSKSGLAYEIHTEEANGEILNDTLYLRNITVEERFNVEIVPVWTDAGTDDSKVVVTSILADSDDFDLAGTYVFVSGNLVTNRVYLNWLELKYTNLEKPWWVNSINNNFRIGNAIYTAVGDMCVTTLRLSYAMFYNKRLAENFEIPDVNKSVYDNKWTIDYFIKTTRDIYVDLNGDGKADLEDMYGFTAEALTNLDMYLPAFNIPIIKQNEQGLPELVMNTPKTLTAVEKVNDLYWGGTGSYIANNCFEAFFGGRAIFFTTWISRTFNELREMEDDYGILPYPKFDESQEKYMSGAMDNYTVLGIPITVGDPEMASIVTEALNAESYKQLFPAYYDTALKVKYMRDEESIAMLDIIMNGRNFDMCVLFSSDLGQVTFMFRSLVAAKSTDFVSSFEKVKDSVQTRLDKIIEICTTEQ